MIQGCWGTVIPHVSCMSSARVLPKHNLLGTLSGLGLQSSEWRVVHSPFVATDLNSHREAFLSDKRNYFVLLVNANCPCYFTISHLIVGKFYLKDFPVFTFSPGKHEVHALEHVLFFARSAQEQLVLRLLGASVLFCFIYLFLWWWHNRCLRCQSEKLLGSIVLAVLHSLVFVLVPVKLQGDLEEHMQA